MPFDEQEYQREYHREKITTFDLYLNRRNEDDMRILDWIEQQPEGANGYLKRLILADMAREESK